MKTSTLRPSAVVAGTLSLTLLAACTPSGDSGGSGGGTADDPAEITWAIGGSMGQTGGVAHTLAQMFNDSQETISVTVESLPAEADSQREQQVLELQSEGTGFDVLAVDVVWTGEYAENGWLESFEDERSSLEGELLAGPMESASWGGELWAVPYSSNAGFLYYRTDLVDTPPTTWDEMCQMAGEVTATEGIGGYISQGAQYEGLTVNWLERYWGAGGELLNEDQSEVVFDPELATQTTQWFAEGQSGDCFAPGFNTAHEEEARNEFQEGNAVFMRNWPYVWSLIEEDAGGPAHGNTGIAPLPTQTGEGTISALGGYNNGVSAFSQNKEAAREFTLWLATDEEAQRTLATEASQPPVLQSVYDNPELAEDPVMSLLGEVLAEARPRPPAPQWTELSVEMQRAIFPAYNGEGDPAAASQRIDDFLNAQFGQ